MSRQSAASARCWTYTYNALGELVSQRDSLNQSTTMVYDNLGRMTKRTEPDLVSEWSYDRYFSDTAPASTCAKGAGKLCEAKAANGYNRKHTYDTLGRQASTTTVLDSTIGAATVSETFDVASGRVLKKTWPTGYEASYTYTALGYLKEVKGGGTNGFSQTVGYRVTAMNAQGQITQYKTGDLVTNVNMVTADKTFDVATQRLMGQMVTQDGQAAGNVLNQDAAQASYTYDKLGNLLSRKDLSPGVNTQESFSYDSLNRLTLSTMLSGAVAPLSNTEVKYDARGNITYKSDVGRYWYDAARPNRMTNVTLETAPGATQPLTGTRALAYAFDDLKAGAQSVNGTSLGNGNLEYTVSHDAVNNRHTVRYESYTSFNMPKDFVYGNFITNTSSTADRTLSFVYGPEHQRIRQNVALSGNGTSSYFAGNTWYLNGPDSLGLAYEEEVRANGTTEHKHYVGAGGVTFALFTSRTGTLNGLPATSRSYFHHDHLGSIAVVTDENGAVTERLAYDPWGKRRFINSTAGMPDKLDAIVGQKTDRGFTLHEHLDEIGIIHMNGRVYDPLIGRFMSADPYVQAPENLQSYNRYAYVINNPLTLTDPSGYFWGWIVAAIAEVFHQVGILDTKTTRTIQAVAIAFETGQWVGGSTASGGLGMGSVAAGAAGGAAGGFVASNGSLEAAAQGAFTGAVFGWAGLAGGPGEAGANSLKRYAAHAGAGCVSAAAFGGNCGQGAASAVFGKFTTNAIGSSTVISGDLAKGIASAVAGGVGSVIAGGKFENGAVTAAYGYLFNFLLSQEANVNRGGAVKDTNFSVDFDSSFEIDMRDPPRWAKLTGLNKVPGRLFMIEDAREAGVCAVISGCWGTRNLPPETKEMARKLDVDAAKAASNVVQQNPGWKLNNLTRSQTIVVLDGVNSAVPDFSKYYGTTQQLMNRFRNRRD